MVRTSRRITNNPAIDTTPTWSPTGQQIAFTSDRSGGPQVYVDGRRRPQRAPHLDRLVLRPRHVVAGAVQRARVRLQDGRRLRHQDLTTLRAGTSGRSPMARAATRVPRIRRTASTSRSRPRDRARRRSTPLVAMARTSGKSRKWATISFQTGLGDPRRHARMNRWLSLRSAVVLLLVVGAVACGKKQPPIARPIPPPPPMSTPVMPPPEPPAPAPEPRSAPGSHGGAGRLDRIAVARRDQQELAVEAGVLQP